MFTIASYFIGFASGIAGYYWYSHKVNPDAAQQTTDAAKGAVLGGLEDAATSVKTAVETEVNKVV